MTGSVFIPSLDNNTKKRTCLWLKGLPKLEPTNMLPEPEPIYYRKDGKKMYWTEALSGSTNG